MHSTHTTSIDDAPSLVTQSPKQANINEAKNNNLSFDEPNNFEWHTSPKRKVEEKNNTKNQSSSIPDKNTSSSNKENQKTTSNNSIEIYFPIHNYL